MKIKDFLTESEYAAFSVDSDIVESTCVFEAGMQCPYLEECELEEGRASRALCLSRKSDDQLGASMLSSCKAQGLRARDGRRRGRVGDTVVSLAGKRIKSSKYGGPLPYWTKDGRKHGGSSKYSKPRRKK